MIRIVIAARSAVVRAGLEALLASAPGLEVAGSFADATGIDALRPDVLLAAGEAAGVSGAPAVLLTNEDQPVWTADALRSGVRALLPRDASPATILAAVEAAANGLALVDPQELEALLGAAAPVPQPVDDSTATVPPVTLTPREREVLRMMADGAANKEIAWKLGISEHTAKFHVASILGKLNAGSRTEAVAIGLRTGLILI
ncbi:MAG TPA: response regulator transcription factor [Rhizomicrobium sp.]|nr:response regulator transcription factor [Bryobacteraceae bacterium]